MEFKYGIVKDYENLYHDNKYKFYDFKCLEYNRNVTDKPWYPINNLCPCDINYNNISGRGYMVCPYGVQLNNKEIQKDINQQESLKTIIDDVYTENTNGYLLNVPIYFNENNNKNNKDNIVQSPLLGSLYQNSQYVPPSLDPRELKRIGYEWRS